MGRLLMRFFHLSSQRHHSLFSKDLDTFYHSLIKDLGQLDQSLFDGSISLQWSAAAEDDWFDQYMHDSMSMLDFCNSLKFAVARMSQYCMMVEIIIQNLSNNGNNLQAVSSKSIKFEKSESESQIYLCAKMMRETIRLGCRVQAKRKIKENKSTIAAMLAAKRTMVVVSVLLISAIVSPVSIELGGCDLNCRFPQLKQLVDILSTLVCRFHERASVASKGSGFVLLEQEIVGRVIVDLQDQVVKGVKDKERFFSTVELLKSSSIGLKEGIEKLDAAVDDAFEVVMKGRNEMMGVLRDRDFSMR